ncbi:MAG: hypothetical protein H7Y07_06490 [Pyrinomonadaceae bacterium]|nr:hypothetical protein [Sphingobacteriaceae bacterium]
MVTKEFEMFYFDDKTFINLCKQLEKEIKTLTLFTSDNANDLRLAYQKFELFLSVYHHSRKRDDIDYKTETRMEIAAELNQLIESDPSIEINEEYQSENFYSAKDKLDHVMEDLIYQIAMRNLATSNSQ